jgi:hypothetical protein
LAEIVTLLPTVGALGLAEKVRAIGPAASALRTPMKRNRERMETIPTAQMANSGVMSRFVNFNFMMINFVSFMFCVILKLIYGWG